MTNYPRWSRLPYAGEEYPPKNPEEPLAGTWPLIFLQRDNNGWFKGPLGDSIPKVIHPYKVNWKMELQDVQDTLENLTLERKLLAEYWGTGHVTKQWTPIIDRLIDTYTVFTTKIPPMSLTTPEAARILALTEAAIQDAGVVAWAIKYRYDVARPNQQDPNLVTYICTPRHPSYISGHAIVAGVASEVLSYFFPAERERLTILAEECAVARVYGGVHYPIDGTEGLRLGRAIAKSLTSFFATQVDALGNPVDEPFIEDKNAIIPPDGYPYQQAIPFDFISKCQSRVVEETLFSKITKNFLGLFGAK
ncbi:hypothetical protein HNQ94_000940 [Salirhabdus euzebyi]|uniref:Phosphatidic acid phosphatase type 2/haloperoxidase domain-containing protein n=1 Tax=Salirhabdus euzebyi TaxID=394506 RepID=A0A841Q2F5_9BACI|nr:vanadium-dependent haloperoxidase [Salirhabdus euzebyi]MBB6452495.1 hypothetical protein [Salirhabdus euzebyi]